MLIKPDVCIGCGNCMPFCPVEAIHESDKNTAKGKVIRAIDLDQCVECGVCLRAAICPVDAIAQQPLEWPRMVRSAFSNPVTPHRNTGILGRGTEEMKTNEVTNRFIRGQLGVAVEVGRPGVGTSMRDIDRLTQAMAKLGVEFEPQTPVTGLMSDPGRGTMSKEVLGEKVLSAIIEFKLSEKDLEKVLSGLREVAKTLDTVFSLGVISVLPEGCPDPLPGRIEQMGFKVRPNGKVNLGLGRALPRNHQ